MCLLRVEVRGGLQCSMQHGLSRVNVVLKVQDNGCVSECFI